jgi:hypothetical protein
MSVHLEGDIILHILANGFLGHSELFNYLESKNLPDGRIAVTGYHSGLTKNPDGSYSFSATIQFENEEHDKLIGTIKDRHIVFTRTRLGKDAFVQKYDGWLFESLREDKCVAQMAGTFSHNGSTLYGWCGWISKRPIKNGGNPFNIPK